MVDGILRQKGIISRAQEQTRDTFGFKWSRKDSYEGAASIERLSQWLASRYLGGDSALLSKYFPDGARVMDAGCGVGLSFLSLAAQRLDKIRYLGVDISAAVELARDNFLKAGHPGEFMQANLGSLPFSEPVFEAIFSEGVLHHTDSTEKSLKYLSRLLTPGGYFLFYVYRKKGPVREFCDDHVRAHLKPMSDSQAWEALKPLSKLGQALGEMKVEINVPEDIDFLGIKAGPIDLQRFFYWHFCKAYHYENYDLESINHINFDWYRPLNCHRHTEQEIRRWCEEAGLDIERIDSQESGFTVAARKISA
ncbi:class I SAM-dependent methyltransferase (plasmid) [Deltaproteobacteria bacterium Smac51]|nr:class I SAM-dependent methyltransferase [Deltaproteobacteria bacterium Smac51]